MIFEIHANKLGKPYLKKVDRPRRTSEDGRGTWVPIGRLSEIGIENALSMNAMHGYRAILDEDNTYRVLVLTD